MSSPAHELTVFEDLPGLEAEHSYLPPETAEESPYFTQITEFSRALLRRWPSGSACGTESWPSAWPRQPGSRSGTGEPVDFTAWREQIGGAP